MDRKKYHHGNLESALVAAALEMIRTEGVEALTLRAVGSKVGVSRTALYRHFSDKGALMARVAAEGFRLLRDALGKAATASDPVEEMGVAYVQFALANEGHYRAMFGRMATDWCQYPELMVDGDSAFQVLLDAVATGQTAGRMRPADPMGIARVLWAAMHGVAMLTMDGHLIPEYGVARLAGCYLRDGVGTR